MHDQILKQAGGSLSKFHAMAFVSLAIIAQTSDFLVLNMVYLLLFPTYNCIDENGFETPCKRVETCQSWNFRETKVINNWVNHFDLRCKSNYQIGMFCSIFFFGKVLGMITLSSYGDSIGRIRLLRFSQSATLACFITITFLIQDSKYLNIPIFVIGLLNSWRNNLGYIYCQEIFDSLHKNMAGTLLLVNDMMTLVWSSLFFRYVSIEWTQLFTVYIFLIALSVVILFKMPESPQFLIDKKRFREAENAYNVIAQFNGLS